MQSNMEALLMETGGTFLRKMLLGFYEVAPEDSAMAPLAGGIPGQQLTAGTCGSSSGYIPATAFLHSP